MPSKRGLSSSGMSASAPAGKFFTGHAGENLRRECTGLAVSFIVSFHLWRSAPQNPADIAQNGMFSVSAHNFYTESDAKHNRMAYVC